jgi:hypothetical protein
MKWKPQILQQYDSDIKIDEDEIAQAEKEALKSSTAQISEE